MRMTVGGGKSYFRPVVMHVSPLPSLMASIAGRTPGTDENNVAGTPTSITLSPVSAHAYCEQLSHLILSFRLPGMSWSSRVILGSIGVDDRKVTVNAVGEWSANMRSNNARRGLM
jgi:hypothetical protein